VHTDSLHWADLHCYPTPLSQCLPGSKSCLSPITSLQNALVFFVFQDEIAVFGSILSFPDVTSSYALNVSLSQANSPDGMLNGQYFGTALFESLFNL